MTEPLEYPGPFTIVFEGPGDSKPHRSAPVVILAPPAALEFELVIDESKCGDFNLATLGDDVIQLQVNDEPPVSLRVHEWKQDGNTHTLSVSEVEKPEPAEGVLNTIYWNWEAP